MAEVGRILATDPQLNLSHNGVLALLGNAGHESAGFTTGVQDQGPGRGLFQWDSRRPEFEAYLRNHGFRADDWMNPQANAGFVKQELLGGEGRKQTYDIPGFGAMSVLDAFRSNQIPLAELVDVGHQEYERPADTRGGQNAPLTSNASRQDWAQRAGNLFTQWGSWANPAPINPQGYGPGVTGEDAPGLNLTAPNDPFNIKGMLPGASPYGNQRSGGADVFGYDLTGLAFDRDGNPLPNTAVSGAIGDALRGLRESYETRDYTPAKGGGPGGYRYNPETGAYDPIFGGSPLDLGETNRFNDGTYFDPGPTDNFSTDPTGGGNSTVPQQTNYGGRYMYAGDIRPQDAIFLDENPGSMVTREGRQILPANYAPLALGLDPDSSDFKGRYSYSGPLSLEDALWLKQNPLGSIGAEPLPGPRTTNDYSAADAAVSAGVLNGFDTPQQPWTAPPNTIKDPNFSYFLPTSALRGGTPTGEYTRWAPEGAQTGDFGQFGMGHTTGWWQQAPDGTEWSDYPRYGGSQLGGDTMGGHPAWVGSFQRMNYATRKAQADAEAQRAATDASIATNLATGNANNPSSVFSNVNSPVVNTSGNNPTDINDNYFALRGF